MWNKIKSYLSQKSTWTGGSTLGLLAGMIGLEDVKIKAGFAVVIALINAYDVLRNEDKIEAK